MLTYQDYEKAPNRVEFLARLINEHMGSRDYQTARDADRYDRQQNVTINRVADIFKSDDGRYSARICCNEFFMLNTGRVAYLLGNGVSFNTSEMRLNERGYMVPVDTVKEKLGSAFDEAVYRWARYALIHGISFGFWDMDHLRVYPLTQFAPLWDENTNTLRAGARFWRIDPKKPMWVELYEEDGMTTYRSREGTTGFDLVEAEPKRAYVRTVFSTDAVGVIAEEGENYGDFPVVPMYGSSLHQSTLIGMREWIDAIDMVASGFARDMRDCTKIYWLIQNCGGMNREERLQFLDEINTDHIAQVDTKSFSGDARGALSPYVQDVPYQGNAAFLSYARAQLYENFGAVDVHTISAGATNDHIDAAYQPMDNVVDDFETEVTKGIKGILRLMGIDDTPRYKRNRVSNMKEQIEAVMLEANYLDEETMLDKLPNITVDEKAAILARRDREAGEIIVPNDRK